MLCLEIQFLWKAFRKKWCWEELASSNYFNYHKHFLTKHQRRDLTMKRTFLLMGNVDNIFEIQRLQDPNKGLVHLYNFSEVSNKQRFNGWHECIENFDMFFVDFFLAAFRKTTLDGRYWFSDSAFSNHKVKYFLWNYCILKHWTSFVAAALFVVIVRWFFYLLLIKMKNSGKAIVLNKVEILQIGV